ncbi:MAG: PEP-CTERM sorting domain-containing protein, partial [Cyanobacteria bacterium J06642_11]
YNGKNKSDSWKNESFLGSWTNALKVEDNGKKRTISFDLDASGLNAADVSDDWKGVKFEENVGIWFHAGNRTNVTYNEDGTLKSFGTKAAYFDSKALETTAVPEPMTTAGLALVGGMAFVRRRKGQ